MQGRRAAMTWCSRTKSATPCRRCIFVHLTACPIGACPQSLARVSRLRYAEACRREAVTTALEQGVLSVELLAAMNLCRMAKAKGEAEKAASILTAVCSPFQDFFFLNDRRPPKFPFLPLRTPLRI